MDDFFSLDQALFGLENLSLLSSTVGSASAGSDLFLPDLAMADSTLGFASSATDPFTTPGIVITDSVISNNHPLANGDESVPYVKVGDNLFTVTTLDFPESFKLTEELPMAKQDLMQWKNGGNAPNSVGAWLGCIDPILLQHQPRQLNQRSNSIASVSSLSSLSSLDSNCSTLSSIMDSPGEDEDERMLSPLSPTSLLSTATAIALNCWNHNQLVQAPLLPSHQGIATKMPVGMTGTSDPTLPVFANNNDHLELGSTAITAAAAAAATTTHSNSFILPGGMQLLSMCSSTPPQLETNASPPSTGEPNHALPSLLANGSPASASAPAPTSAPAFAAAASHSPQPPTSHCQHSRATSTPLTHKSRLPSWCTSSSQPSHITTSSSTTPTSISAKLQAATVAATAAIAATATASEVPKKARSVIRDRKVAGSHMCPKPGCGYRYNLRRELNRHMNTHAFATTDRYRCLTCNAGLCRLDSVKRHMEAKGKQACLDRGIYGEYDDRGQLLRVRECRPSWYASAAALRDEEQQLQQQ